MRALTVGLFGLVLPGVLGCARDAPDSPVAAKPVQEPPPVSPARPEKPAAPEPGAKEEEKATTHRVGAGEPDASGWYPATSTKGRFSVSLPNRFTDITEVSRRMFGVPSESYMLGTRVKGIQFTAIELTRGDGKPAATTLQGAVDLVLAKAPKAVPKDERRVIRKGIEGKELTLSNASWTIRMRVLMAGGRIYSLLVEYPTRSAEGAPAQDIERFFDSFELRKDQQAAP